MVKPTAQQGCRKRYTASLPSRGMTQTSHITPIIYTDEANDYHRGLRERYARKLKRDAGKLK